MAYEEYEESNGHVTDDVKVKLVTPIGLSRKRLDTETPFHRTTKTK